MVSINLQSLPTWNSATLTPTKAKMMLIQISGASGIIKENTLGSSSFGFFIIMLIPVVMYGLVKLTTRSLMEFMVSGAAAMSAFWKTI